MDERAPHPASFDNPADAPDSEDTARLARIRERFAAANYTVAGIESLIGPDAAEALHRDIFIPAVEALAARDDRGGELGALIECLLLGRPVVASALPAVDDLIGARIVARVGAGEALPATEVTGPAGEIAGTDGSGRAPASPGDLVEALVDIRPYEADEDAWWIASDLGGAQLTERTAARGERATPGALRRDHVVGIGPATTLLAQLTPRDAVPSAFDLGVGMGVQTMHLLAHARRVVATDISARALAIARFNLLLNAESLGLTASDLDPANRNARVSLRLGNMLEPVAGEAFDLVVSNPPFVITPRRADGERASERFTYRDGGREGDAIMRELVTGLGGDQGILAPGGIACMLGNWEVRDGAPWSQRIEDWAADDLDAWVVLRERATPAEYADMWLRDAAENAELASWRESFSAYLDDFRRRGVEGVGMGLLSFRRRTDAAGGAVDAFGRLAPRRDADGSLAAGGRAAKTGAPVRLFEDLPHQLGQPLGPVIAGVWARTAWLREVGDALFDETLVVAGDVTEERHTVPGDEHPRAMLLRQGGGFRRTFPLSTELAGFVGVCDGELSAGQITAALGAILDVDEARIRQAIEADVRDLITLGFLEPAWV